ncbi:extracellular matrix protein 1 [Echeneis naucrates]|uniref:Extracellular matrix protein 1b n=1 Tax=Echeneis naucrates TaxID=173247 RepID=A0A665UZE5_ECHNA|nr:extracellular matrix protein 1 [Echeneis naucrates]
MASSWALLSSTVLVLVWLSSASRDESSLEQREVTLGMNDKDMAAPELHILQREMTWEDLFDPSAFIEQAVVNPSKDLDNQWERGQPFRPRSSFNQEYPVQFPLGRPTTDNLQAICLYGDRRPRYSDSYFPGSGYGQQKRMASAVNNAETWFGTCCTRNQTWERDVTLCCATQAWELSVMSFCQDSSSVKDHLYHCCKLQDNDRLNCFNSNAENPNYEPTEEIPLPPLSSPASFYFDPNNCPRAVMSLSGVRGKRRSIARNPLTSQEVDINFPPGRPTADTIESLCATQNQRPRYSVKCLPRAGYELLARQAKTINRMEKGFKQCCRKKKGVLNCAEQKWSEELKRFCSLKTAGQAAFHCCLSNEESESFNCFQNISPDPHYNMTSTTQELSLNKICDTHKIIKKKFPVGFPLKSLVDQCCPLSEQDKTVCSMQKLQEMSGNLCSSGRALPPAVRRCCQAPSQETPQCISKILLNAISKATNVLARKKVKRCPIS